MLVILEFHFREVVEVEAAPSNLLISQVWVKSSSVLVFIQHLAKGGVDVIT
jgi:hypothetical protein